MVKRHFVVLPKMDGGVEVYSMKGWLKQHPERIPPGMDPSISTSWQLRSGLKKLGWVMQEDDAQVRMIPPEGMGDQSIVDFTDIPLTDREEEEEGPYFSLEYQLRDFLAANLETVQINGNRLKLYNDDKGSGVEYPTSVGPVDILATANDGAFYVFELKRANGADRAIGQLARYMGWVKQNLGLSKDVHGVIVARNISEQLRFARTVVPNIHLFEYQISFTLRQSHELQALR